MTAASSRLIPPQQLDPDLAALLALGQRFVVNNIELTIYAPGSNSFHAEIFDLPAGGSDELRSYKLPYLDFDPAVSEHTPGCAAWISGSL